MSATTTHPRQQLLLGLSVLGLLFALRVAAQWQQSVAPLPMLPPFQAWHSEALPYPLLLAAQFLILLLMTWTINAIHRGRLEANKAWGEGLVLLAGWYFALMCLRLTLGLTLLADYRWFSSHIPSLFHLILASFVWLVGQYHLQQGLRRGDVLMALRKMISWLGYPITMIMALFLFQLLQAGQQSVLVSSYVAVITTVVVIVVLEHLLPERDEWQASKSDIKTDLDYMLIVQIALPRLVALVTLLLVVPLWQQQPWASATLWPHHWHIAAQVILMLVVVEFFRYWLHRAAHTIPWLWRLHAVHHAPSKLYLLNVGRFHPLEKLLQMLLDSVPFILFGIDEVVLGLYFVLYATNGFFQHCNIRLRYGPLNYLVSSAELHRWHHSCNRDESRHNYGNNLILWDLLFGSFFLPANKRVAQLGNGDNRFPAGFLAQVRYPLQDVCLRDKLSRIWQRLLLSCYLLYTRLFLWLPLWWASRIPAKVQRRVLNQIIRNNRQTLFARQHNFTAIKSIADFRHYIAINEYEDLSPFIWQQITSADAILTRQQPIFYATSSGTTGAAKYLPVNKKSLRQQQQAQALFTLQLCQQHPQALCGRILAINSPTIDGMFDNGIAHGAISGLIASKTATSVKGQFIVPDEILALDDYEQKYHLICYLALQQANISLIVTPNPSTLLRLMDILNEHMDRFIQSLATGRYFDAENIPEHIRCILIKHTHPQPERAAQIARLAATNKRLGFAELWPGIKVVATWTGGSCGLALKGVQGQLPRHTTIFELGYIASEFRGTIPLANHGNSGLPLINQQFYEFIDVKHWEVGGRETLLLDQLQNGREYYIIVTTASGLYRYFINDIVRVSGFFHNTPLLEFIQKGKGVTNICGEKLYEGQLSQAIKELESSYGLHARFHLMLASVARNSYTLYLETDEIFTEAITPIAQTLDKQLCRLNMEYHARRASGRLHDVQIILLRQHSGEAYKRHRLAHGIREGQYKHLTLAYEDDNDFDFEQLLPV